MNARRVDSWWPASGTRDSERDEEERHQKRAGGMALAPTYDRAGTGRGQGRL